MYIHICVYVCVYTYIYIHIHTLHTYILPSMMIDFKAYVFPFLAFQPEHISEELSMMCFTNFHDMMYLYMSLSSVECGEFSSYCSAASKEIV